jgi:hypothetical protein
VIKAIKKYKYGNAYVTHGDRGKWSRKFKLDKHELKVSLKLHRGIKSPEWFWITLKDRK